jgi:hypothetical protein
MMISMSVGMTILLRGHELETSIGKLAYCMGFLNL